MKIRAKNVGNNEGLNKAVGDARVLRRLARELASPGRSCDAAATHSFALISECDERRGGVN